LSERTEILLLALAGASILVLWLLGLRRGGRFAEAGGWVSGVIPVVVLGLVVVGRWERNGQGPFLSLYDVILSNLFTAGLFLLLAGSLSAAARASLRVAYPILLLLTAWALTLPLDVPPLPPTFDNPWLWVHVVAGKLFLASCLVATSLSLLLLGQAAGARRLFTTKMPARQLDNGLWRFAALAFVFHSLMLVAGAAWANDAWGRYWAWDPLELWTFLTWLLLGIVLHLRVTLRLPAWVGWCGICAVFLLAFLTFLGVPFVSLGPHKGVM